MRRAVASFTQKICRFSPIHIGPLSYLKRLPILPITIVFLALFNVYILHKYNQLRSSIPKSQRENDNLNFADRLLAERSPERNRRFEQLKRQYRIYPTELAACNSLIGTSDESSDTAKAFELYALQHKTTLSGFLEFHEDELDKHAFESCPALKKSRKYIKEPLSAEEADFPIAYSIVIHKNLETFERLFRAIYQPQNYYCIHVDQKASDGFKQRVSEFVSCFDNTIEPERKASVYYAHYSRVEADLHCLHALEKFQYKYVFNLCGQDFPLKTNLELVRDLKGLNGRDETESVDIEKVGKLGRVLKGYKVNASAGTYGNTLIRDESKDKPWQPFAPSLGKDTGLFAGSAYFLLTKPSVDFILHDKNVRDFFAWSRDSWSPDEHIWATLFRHAPVPGSISAHKKYEMNELISRTRLVKWYGLDRKDDKSNKPHNVALYGKCKGRWQRGYCVYGAMDLPFLVKSRHWFANKFDQKVDAIAIDCLDVWLRERALNQSFEYVF